MIKVPVIFICGLKYSFRNDDGKLIEGVSVRFISDDGSANSDNFIGSRVQKMSMPIDQWDSLVSQGVQTFSKVELTLAGFGRTSRLVKVEKVSDNG